MQVARTARDKQDKIRTSESLYWRDEDGTDSSPAQAFGTIDESSIGVLRDPHERPDGVQNSSVSGSAAFNRQVD